MNDPAHGALGAGRRVQTIAALAAPYDARAHRVAMHLARTAALARCWNVAGARTSRPRCDDRPCCRATHETDRRQLRTGELVTVALATAGTAWPAAASAGTAGWWRSAWRGIARD